jgi:hypothetical protein
MHFDSSINFATAISGLLLIGISAVVAERFTMFMVVAVAIVILLRP